MRQCGEEDYPLAVLEQPTPPEVPDPGIPAGWMLLALFAALLIFELWALKTKHNTISHLLQRLSRRFTWLRWLGALGLGLLGWHLFWGFPW